MSVLQITFFVRFNSKHYIVTIEDFTDVLFAFLVSFGVLSRADKPLFQVSPVKYLRAVIAHIPVPPKDVIFVCMRRL